jgi:hypothetical protein
LSHARRKKDFPKDNQRVEGRGKRPSATPSIQDLTRSSSLIFTGIVVQHGSSTVPILSPNEKMVAVRVDRGLRVDPVLGDLHGKIITVVAGAPESLSVGQKAVFFTNSWIHGRGIAVREVDHWDVGEEESVAAAVAQLPELHLMERLRSAELVVDAQVVRMTQVKQNSHERNAALWTAAQLQVKKVLRGQQRKSTMLFFPTADRPPWTNAPRFKERQRGIFILHRPSRSATLSEATLEADSLVALDPADFQPESQLPEVERLLAAVVSEGRIP